MTSRKGCIISPQNSVSNFFWDTLCLWIVISVYSIPWWGGEIFCPPAKRLQCEANQCWLQPFESIVCPKERNTFRERRTEIHCFTQRKNDCWTIQSNHKMEERLMLGVHKKSILFHFTVLLCYCVTWYNLVVDQHMICLICFGFSKPYCDTPIFPWRTPSRNLVWEQWVTGGGGSTSMCLYFIVLHLYPATSCDWRGWRYIIFPGLLSGGCHNSLVAQMLVYIL